MHGVSSVTARPGLRWEVHLAAIIAIYAAPFLIYFPTDLPKHLLPWFAFISAVGPIEAFSAPFGNYTPPYLYVLAASTFLPLNPVYAIKLTSVLGAAWLGYSVFRLASVLEQPASLALWALLLPSAVLNVPFLAQADTYWVAPCLLATAAAIEGRMLRLVVWSGVAIAFKAQAAFFAPFVIATLISERASWKLWLVPPAVYSAAMFPAWLAGWPAWDLATIYLRQSEWQPRDGTPFVGNAPNLWSILGALDINLAMSIQWMGIVAAGLAAVAFVVALPKRLSSQQMLAAVTLSATVLPWLLPRMHERFFILADVMAFLYAATVRTPRAILIAILIQISSAGAVFGFMLETWAGAFVGCFLLAAAMGLLVLELPLRARRDDDHRLKVSSTRRRI